MYYLLRIEEGLKEGTGGKLDGGDGGSEEKLVDFCFACASCPHTSRGIWAVTTFGFVPTKVWHTLRGFL